MRILQIYIIRQILAVFFVCIIVFTFILLVGNMLKVIELLSKGISFVIIFQFLLYLLPFMLAYSIPMSILTAVLLSFAKLSAENEINAIRANGINLKHIFRPIFGCVLILVIFCYALNDRMRPNAIFEGRKLLLKIGIQEPAVYIKPGRFNELFPDHAVYVGDRNGVELKRVVIYKFNQDRLSNVITAEKGTISYSEDKKNPSVFINLFNGDIAEIPQEDKKPGGENRVRFDSYIIEFNTKAQIQDLRKLTKKEREMTNVELYKKAKHLKEQARQKNKGYLIPEIEARISSILTRINNRLAVSFSCFVFILIGIPLGIRVHRKETSIGIGISLILVAGYYLLITFAEALQEKACMRPWLLMWMPNIVLLVVGMILINRLLKR